MQPVWPVWLQHNHHYPLKDAPDTALKTSGPQYLWPSFQKSVPGPGAQGCCSQWGQECGMWPVWGEVYLKKEIRQAQAVPPLKSEPPVRRVWQYFCVYIEPRKSWELSAHSKIWLEMPFSCKEWGAEFERVVIWRHIWQHIHKKYTFFCKECWAVFPGSGHRKRHMQTHTGAGFSQW